MLTQNNPVRTELSRWKDKVLFTPGPLTTSPTVKQAMLTDLGSRDHAFIAVVREIRRRLVALGQADENTFTAIPMQGSGTFGLEAVIASCIPAGGSLLVIVNGAYGQRIANIASVLGIETKILACAENRTPDLDEIETALQQAPKPSMLAVVHCETTSGIVNPICDIGRRAHAAGVPTFVDAMSSFGAIPVDLEGGHIDYLVSSANKCIEGVPGFSFVLARRAHLEQTSGWARSLSLDLYDQWQGLERNGQFRFTPPTHALLAFYQALLELEQEGGVAARAARYRNNHETLIAGMRALGFQEYLEPEDQGIIITSFRTPDHPRFDFAEFYDRLNRRHYVIYPGKVSNADCFRIGNIGRLFPSDVQDLLHAIADVMDEMKCALPVVSDGRRISGNATQAKEHPR
jgi:2-aminoethylphosphonate-pyruvate transaminase